MKVSLLFVVVLGISVAADVPVKVDYYYANISTPSTKVGNRLSLIDPELPVKFIIHGYIEYAAKQYIQDLTKAYLSIENYNILQVDWKEPANKLLYSESAALTRNVGENVADYVMALHDDLGISLDNIHIIGHSLGAQVAGFAGQYIFAKSGQKIARITGLDPAGPLFLTVGDNNRLSADDAILVDNIHTDGGVFGYFNPCGKVDTYVNRGTALQPGCTPVDLLLTGDLFTNTLPESVFCSHARSHHYFTYAVTNSNLKATQCSSYTKFIMGGCNLSPKINIGDDLFSLSPDASGKYYLSTNGKPPYYNTNSILV